MSDTVGTILVSAHPDDVALSVGGSILAGFFKRPLLLVTVFSYGGTAPFYHGSHDVENLFELMVKEDKTFANAIGSRLLQLKMNDAALDSKSGEHFKPLRWLSSIIRGRPPPNNNGFEFGLEGLTERVPRTLRWSLLKKLAELDVTYIHLKEKLSQVLSRFPDATLASPLSLGLHPDHVLVSSACQSLAKNTRVYYYEDLPYSMGYSLDGIQRHITRFDKNLRPVLVDIDRVMDGKVENLRLYASQLGSWDITRVLKHSKRLTTNGRVYERVWKYK